MDAQSQYRGAGLGGLNATSAAMYEEMEGSYGASAKQISGEPVLSRIASQIGEATERVNMVAARLSDVAVGIHGPRPEAVGDQTCGAMTDSLMSRTSNLMDSIERLERIYGQLVR